MSSDRSDSSDFSSSDEDPFHVEYHSDVSDSESDSEITTKSGVKVRSSDINSVVDTVSRLQIHSKSTSKSKSNTKSDTKSNTKSNTKSDTVRLTGERKTIFFEDDPAKPVTATGIIMYRYNGKEMQLLLINVNNKLEDIGGKIDKIDVTIEDAAAREVEEETNGKIKASDIIDRLKNTHKNQKIYVNNSKYLIYIIKASDAERQLTVEDFGNYESVDKIKRTIQWVPRDTVFSTTFIRGGKLNYRIKSLSLKNTLVSLDKSKKLTKSLFN